MLKKLIFCFGFILTVSVGFSQENTASPYSYYGLGEQRFKGTQEAKAMGGLAITGDSIAINLNNPASYSRLFVTTFSIGGTSTFSKMKTSSEDESAKRTSLDYLAVGVPMGKFGAAFGLMPYSVVGYKIKNTIVAGTETRKFQQDGSGNINRVFAGFSYNYNKNLSFGVNLEYNFGSTSDQIRESIVGVQLSTREKNEYTVNGISANFGVLYDGKLGEKKNFYSSLTYAPKSELNLEHYRNLATVFYSPNGTEYVNDYVEQN